MIKRTSLLLGLTLFTCVLSLSLSAQQNEIMSPVASSSTSASANTERPVLDNRRLTFRDRWDDYRDSTFQPTVLVFPAIAAGYNQMNNDPAEWKQGGEGYGKRLASATGGVVLDNTISFGVAALSREDLRYVRSTYPKKAILRRAGYAIAHTLVSHVSSGNGDGHTLAFSRVAGAYGAGFIANQWYPARRSTLHNAVYLGTFNLTADMGSNLLREFIRPHFVWGSGKAKKTTP